MANVVLVGGNGYIGREFTKQWLKKDPKATFYVVSRSGSNKLHDSRIHNIAADAADYDSVAAQLPERIDYIADFVGRPMKDAGAQAKVNKLPAEVMMRIAEKYEVQAMGFVGGILGPKSFTTLKKDIINDLQKSKVELAVVEPTLVYGEDRNDSLSKLVPIFKFLGIFSKGLRPVTVTEVAEELVRKMIRKRSH